MVSTLLGPRGPSSLDEPLVSPARKSGLLLLGVALAAFGARAWVVLRGDGLHGLVGYDPGVYYAAADALVHGLLPYRDFLLLHPPGLALLLSPFAAAGAATSDATGMALARAAVLLLGVANAVLVARIGLRYGRAAALAGGLFYALWAPVVVVENQARLEPVGNTCLLLALLALLGRRRVSARAEVLAGVALGFGASVKIWGALPLVVILAWQLVGRGRRPAARVAAGALAAVAAACGPFLLAAPRTMVRMVVADQLGRPRIHLGLTQRLFGLIAAPGWSVQPATRTLLVAAAGGLVLAAATMAWRERSARVVVVLLLAQTGLLLQAPSFFSFYAAFLVPAAALTLAVAVHRVAGWTAARPRVAGGLALGGAGLAGLVGIALLVPIRVQGSRPFPGEALGAAAAGRRCVLSDTPLALIEMNVLSRGLRSRCGVEVDVTGYTYEGRLSLAPDGTVLPRSRNAAWQRQVLAYLTSGDAVVLARPETGLSAASRRAIARWPVLARSGGYRLYGRPSSGLVPGSGQRDARTA